LNVTLTEQLADAARLAPHDLLEIAKSPALVPPMLTLLIVMEDFVPFVNEADSAALVEPTDVLGNPRLVGDTLAVPPAVLPPVAERVTDCGLLLAVSEIVSVADREPLAVGLNVTATVQLADAARLLPHVLLAIKKSPGFVPVIAMLLIVIEAVVPFFNVAVCEALVEPTLTLPNERLVGLILTAPVPPVATPDSATVCGLPVAESLKFNVAVRVPLDVGANTMLTVQLPDAARLAPQVLLKI
jgi:hypothetical protein